jgi:uncharacterized repeat protein (TIGR03803 family)
MKIIFFILGLLFTIGLRAQDNNELWFTNDIEGVDGLGEILKLDSNGCSFTHVNDFVTPNSGRSPQGILCEANDGKLYGLVSGGKNRSGVIFSFNPASGAYQKIYDFEGCDNGITPVGSLIQASDGKLYGMTNRGGVYDFGIIFSFDIIGNTFTKLVDFDGLNGKYPKEGNLVQHSNGKLFGMTYNGGSNDMGVIFKFDITSGTYTKLHDLNTLDGANPFNSLIEANDGKLYGMTSIGGTNNQGVLFCYDPILELYQNKFDFDGVNGKLPRGNLMQAGNGKLYGMALGGNDNYSGVIFTFEISSNTFNKIYDFSNTNIIVPYNSLIQATNGKLYSCGFGGTEGYGALFSFDASTNIVTNLYNFDYNNENGANPNSLIQASNGILYGMTNIGGISFGQGSGALFSYSIINDSVIHEIEFNTSIGANPTDKLTYASDGNYYGMTTNGGSLGFGSIFKIDNVTETICNVLNFDNINGSNPHGSLLSADNGKLYGLTVGGGGTNGNNNGVLFSFEPITNNFQKLFHFDSIPNKGGQPYGSLIQASNGKLYGMTRGGVFNNDYGTIFSFNPLTNTFENLYDFDLINGAFPSGSLIQASNGKLYGMTPRGGINGIDCNGVLFSFDPVTNNFSKLIDIDIALGITCNFTAGQGSRGNLVQADNGKLYGTTSSFDAMNYGILFSYDPLTNITSNLHQFNPSFSGNSSRDDFGLIKADNGLLYGKTFKYNEGVCYDSYIYKFNTLNNELTNIYQFGVGNLPSIGNVSLNSCDSITWNGTNYLQSGTYSWTGISSTGCDSIIYLNLTIDNGTFTSSQLTACDSTFWNGISIFNSGTYTHSYLDTNGCISADTLVFNLANETWLIQPQNFIADINTVAVFVAEALGGISFQWQTNTGSGFQDITDGGQFDGATSDTLTISAVDILNDNQEFRCIVTSNLCTDTLSASVLNINIISSIFSIDKSSLVTIFPNPSNDKITIKFCEECSFEDNILIIYNSVGQRIKKYSNLQKEIQIDVDNLFTKGVYFIEIIDSLGRSLEHRKIVLD